VITLPVVSSAKSKPCVLSERAALQRDGDLPTHVAVALISDGLTFSALHASGTMDGHVPTRSTPTPPRRLDDADGHPDHDAVPTLAEFILARIRDQCRPIAEQMMRFARSVGDLSRSH